MSKLFAKVSRKCQDSLLSGKELSWSCDPNSVFVEYLGNQWADFNQILHMV